MATIIGTTVKCLGLLCLTIIFMVFGLRALFIKDKGGQI